MKYQYFILLFIFSFFVSFFESKGVHRFFSSEKIITKEVLKQEIIDRMERVDELRAMKELAAELGIKHVYLFGGSAAAWAHYVYWDLEREAGIGNYDESRFDYDYTSIFRSNQDMDIVIDVSERNQELVEQFEKALQNRFQHFQGDKSAWEVRPLRFEYGSKDKILGNPDFLNQNSDSHSTGLISITDKDDLRIRDFKDWENPDNYFINDVYRRQLHYYRDFSIHRSTKRFKNGDNPEIFSAVRYLTKVFQYQLEMDPDSLIQIREVIEKFESYKDLKNNYTKTWLEKNGKKLYQNAIDLEFAYHTMTRLGLITKLINIRKNPKTKDSLSWWMNKMPLLTKPLAFGNEGVSASELGVDIVAHETNSFEAYESITKSHSGLANVFISRNNIVGETAMHGFGFYTQIGNKGAVGTGLTIRFKIHPQAIEGVDFKKYGSFIIVRNKAILTVIPESLSIPPVEYFRKMAENKLIFDHSDKAVKEKVRRKVGISLNNLTVEENREIALIVQEYVKRTRAKKYGELLSEWFSMITSVDYPEILDQLIERGKFDREIVKNVLTQHYWAETEQGADFLEEFITHKFRNNRDILETVVRKVLSKKNWAETERGQQFFSLMAANKKAHVALVKFVLSKKYWAEKEISLNTFKNFVRENKLSKELARYVFSKQFWAEKEGMFELLQEFIVKNSSNTNVLESIVKDVLSKNYWMEHEKSWKLLNIIISYDRFSVNELILKHCLSQKYWTNHEKGQVLLEKLIAKRKYNTYIARDILSQKHWATSEKIQNILNEFMDERNYYWANVKFVLSKSFWGESEEGVAYIESIVKKGKNNKEIIKFILSQKFWSEHEKGAVFLERIIRKSKYSQENLKRIIFNVFNKEYWANNSKSADLLKLIISYNGQELNNLILEHCLSKKFWAKHERGMEILEMFIGKHYFDKNIIKFILSNEHWASHEKINKVLNDVMERSWNHPHILRHLLSKKIWAEKESGVQALEEIIDKDHYIDDVVKYVIHKDFWAEHEKAVDLLKKLVDANTMFTTRFENIVEHTLNSANWLEHKNLNRLLEYIIEQDDEAYVEILIREHFSKEFWARNKKSTYFLELLLEKKRYHGSIVKYILSQRYWAQHDKAEDFLRKIVLTNYIPSIIDYYILDEKFWLEKEFVKNNTQGVKVIAENIRRNLLGLPPKPPHICVRILRALF